MDQECKKLFAGMFTKVNQLLFIKSTYKLYNMLAFIVFILYLMLTIGFK